MVTEIYELDREYVVATDASGAGIRIQDDEDLDRIRELARSGNEVIITGDNGFVFEFGIDMDLNDVYKLLRMR